jgi:hypothetical protein
LQLLLLTALLGSAVAARHAAGQNCLEGPDAALGTVKFCPLPAKAGIKCILKCHPR